MLENVTYATGETVNIGDIIRVTNNHKFKRHMNTKIEYEVVNINNTGKSVLIKVVRVDRNCFTYDMIYDNTYCAAYNFDLIKSKKGIKSSAVDYIAISNSGKQIIKGSTYEEVEEKIRFEIKKDPNKTFTVYTKKCSIKAKEIELYVIN